MEASFSNITQNFLQISFSVLLYNVTEKPYWQCKWFQVFNVFSPSIILVFSLLATFLMQLLLSHYSSFHMPYLIFHFGFSFHIFCKMHVCKSVGVFMKTVLSKLKFKWLDNICTVQVSNFIHVLSVILEMLLYDVSLSLSQEKQSDSK
jgi:hypothetical protein